MNTRSLLACVAAGILAPIAVTSAATAVGETCNGLAATLVGTPGAHLTGTDGPDVIVTSGAARVESKGGNDTICTTNSAPPASSVEPSVFVISGPGDDFIDRRGDTDPALIGFGNMGPGRDTYHGGPGVDVVGTSDALPDVISTYGGNDSVFTDSVEGPKKQPATIDLGDGDDVFSALDGINARLRVDAGPGIDRIEFGLHKRGAWSLDNGTGLLTREGKVQFTMPGFEWVQVDGHPHQRLRFTGTDAAERLTFRPVTLLAKAAMGGGDDLVTIDDNGSRADGHLVRVDGGSGVNTLAYDGHNPSQFRIDLRKQEFSSSDGARGWVRNIRDLVGTGAEVDLNGDGQANTITWTGCRGGEIRGRGGNDAVTFQYFDGDSVLCPHAPMTAYGDSGDDTITGGPDKDLLVGGSGTDTADGRGGHDKCRQVENAVSC